MLIVWQRALSGKNSFDGSVDIRWDQVRVSVDHSSNEKVEQMANFQSNRFSLQGNQGSEKGETEQRFRQSCRGGDYFRALKI